MKSSNAPLWRYILGAVLVIFLLTFSSPAQEDDPNPDSPTPILLSETGSTRALAVAAENFGRNASSKTKGDVFNQNSTVLLFVTNLNLLPDEGANAFRINVEDSKGRQYRFPVIDINPVKEQEGVFALTVRLTDEIGFWEKTKFKGDVFISVVWRGLASNRARLAIGKAGVIIKEEPAPVSSAVAQPKMDKFEAGESPSYIGYFYSADRTRFLEQATFGPTTALDQRIRRLGLRNWINTQFEINYPSNPYPNLALQPSNIPDTCDAICRSTYYTMNPVQNWFYKEAFYGDAQLRHRIAWTLGEIWVTSGIDVQQSSHMFAYHQLLSKNAFGNYRDLMKDITLSPAMGEYLDMVRSTKNSPNENYAREILQLFSIGLFMLNQDGTVQLDGNGKPIPSYDQNTVNNFTKVLTGWTFCNNPNTAICPNITVGTVNFKDPMILNQNNHDVTAKTLLAYPNAVNPTLPAGQNGAVDLTQALDNIFNHPNVAPFVSRLLIQHLVTSDPTPAYVGRVAAAFNNDGSNVRGDMKAVIRAILLDPEARGNVKTDPKYGKLREPVQFATNIYRHFNVRSYDGTVQSDGYVNPLISPMGQNTFYSPTVFNYYTPDYTVPGTGLNGPEFGIMTTGTAIARANFINSAVFSRINVNINNNAPYGTSINLSEMQALAAADSTGNQLLDALNTKLLHGTMSAQMKSTILTAVLANPTTNPLLRAQTAIYLVASSSQYQVQR